MDALTYALHDLQIRREIRSVISGKDEVTKHWAWQEHAVKRRLAEAGRELKKQRISELTATGLLPTPPPPEDPRRQARAWLGKYFLDERNEIIRQHAIAAGIPQAGPLTIGSVEEKTSRCIERGLLAAPLTPAVRELRAMEGHQFRQHLLTDASRHDGRDDSLAHPLILGRWRQELHVARAQCAADALNDSASKLDPLQLDPAKCTTAILERLNGKRRLFAALVQRTAESNRLHLAGGALGLLIKNLQGSLGERLRRARAASPRPLPTDP